MPPKKTTKNTQWCWWCCHPIKTDVLKMPLEYIDNAYKGVGQFCSFPCMKSYNNDTNASLTNKYNINMLITQYVQDASENPQIEIHCAPPRQALVVFGGNMNIDEFRQNNSVINFTLPPIQLIMYDIEKHQHTSKHNKVIESCDIDEFSENMFGSSKTKVINNPLKIKSSKGKPATIEHVLGMLQQH